MKIFVLFILFFLLSMTFTFLIDLLMGITFFKAMSNLKNPFTVMSLPEYFIVFALLLLMIIPPIVSFIKKRKQTGKA
jgi:hypothetical protein